MPSSVKNSEAIKLFILKNVSENSEKIVKLAVEKFSVTRQNINKHIRRLISDGFLEIEGKTKSARYKLKKLVDEAFTLELSPQIQEDVVWRERVSPLLKNLPKNIFDICNYGFTEMFNNVIDHSSSDIVRVRVQKSAVDFEIAVDDEGVGIFKKIQKDFQLPHERDAIFELSKGKLTSDPQRHTGEGIFFTSRSFDVFAIYSGSLLFFKRNEWKDWLYDIQEEQKQKKGTYILMKIALDSDRTLQEVFDAYSSKGDDYAFTKTHVWVDLARYEGENLVSRSQAKRILARFEKFKEIVLDFKGIEFIGQAFADEIFRVFKYQNPHIAITTTHTVAAVEKMIAHVVSSEK